MKKFLFNVLIFIFSFCLISDVSAEEFTLKTGISVNDVPKTLFGTWQVKASLEETNSQGTFKSQSIDIWTLTRVGDKITLSNPFNGAKAEISVRTVEGSLIVFSKKAPYDNKILTDTISIRLNNSIFDGINYLLLETYSYDGLKLLKTETARYKIKGEKISGDNILK